MGFVKIFTKIAKISSHLTKLSPIMQCPVFMDHSAFNANKSSLFMVGKNHSVLVDSLKIGSDSIVWCDEQTYLGLSL